MQNNGNDRTRIQRKWRGRRRRYTERENGK